jgi:hypothetical protein
VTVHFQRIPRGGAYPGMDAKSWRSGELAGMVRARYYLAGQKFVAVFRPSDAGPEADLRPTVEQIGVAVQYMPIGHAPLVDSEAFSSPPVEWRVVVPEQPTRYAFVVRWTDGREPELATRNGRLVVETDKTVLCPPYEPVVFSGDPTWTVRVVDEPVPDRQPTGDSPEPHRAEPDNPKES